MDIPEAMPGFPFPMIITCPRPEKYDMMKGLEEKKKELEAEHEI